MRKKTTGAIALCSGGLDSTVMLYKARRRFKHLMAISFSYPSKHNKMERKMIYHTCKSLRIPIISFDLRFFKSFKSSLINKDLEIPTGEAYSATNMSSTVVPLRNCIMISIAAGYADSIGYGRILLANHGGDHFIYPDCRPEFITSMNETIEYGTDGRVHLESPFCSMAKSDIVKLGAKLGVDFSNTYSCYNGRTRHCGTCSTCIERRKSFEIAGIEDPTVYEKEI